MRALIAAALALLLGVVLGGVGPRGELRDAQARIAELEAQECDRPVAEGLTALLAAGAAARPRPPAAPQGPEDSAPPERDEAGDAELREVRQGPDEPESVTPGDARERGLDSARAAMELRRAQARASLLERADPDDAQLSDIDDAMADMNDALFELADEVSGRLVAGESPERREMMVFAAEALDIVLVADEQVQSALSDEQLDALDDAAVDPLSYVDPGILDLFSGLERP